MVSGAWAAWIRVEESGRRVGARVHCWRRVAARVVRVRQSEASGSACGRVSGIITKLAAIGLVRSQPLQNVDINIIIAKTEKREKVMAILDKQAFDPTRRLNEIKVFMAYLEQYKKVSKDNRIGYYDRYKIKNLIGMNTTDMDLAHVEEALISCKLLSSGESSDEEKDSAKKKLIEFEKYVFDSMKNYAVSSEIFLPGSSFMKWWGEYREITGTSYSSSLSNLLKNDNNYEAYANGSLEFPLNFV
ncbi:hypothetical protein SO802_001307 [Lithocarpus litseifolius]|uniref:EDS1 EP domain-containing protein n=1 Tax=Lithocarpus litseifolius TaxID=425828 RepID=A0AAW2DUC0_9ROSI